jgi:hypothetical protein
MQEVGVQVERGAISPTPGRRRLGLGLAGVVPPGSGGFPGSGIIALTSTIPATRDCAAAMGAVNAPSE